MNYIMGMPVVISPYCLVTEKRTIRERIFGKPWNPLKKTKRVPGMYSLKNKQVVAHPEIMAQILNAEKQKYKSASNCV